MITRTFIRRILAAGGRNGVGCEYSPQLFELGWMKTRSTTGPKRENSQNTRKKLAGVIVRRMVMLARKVRG